MKKCLIERNCLPCYTVAEYHWNKRQCFLRARGYTSSYWLARLWGWVLNADVIHGYEEDGKIENLPETHEKAKTTATKGADGATSSIPC